MRAGAVDFLLPVPFDAPIFTVRPARADPAPRPSPGPFFEQAVLNDGVGQAEASDHIDDLDADGEPDAG